MESTTSDVFALPPPKVAAPVTSPSQTSSTTSTTPSYLQRVFSQNVLKHVDEDNNYIDKRFLHRDYIIFHAPGMEFLASGLQRSLTSHHSSLAAQLGEIKWDKFADGWPNIEICKSENLHEKDVIFVCCIEQPGDVFEQLSACLALSQLRVRSFSIILPYSPTATFERASSPGQVPSAVPFARMFSMIPIQHELFLIDLHTYANLHYFPQIHVFRSE
eukprot:UN02789